MTRRQREWIEYKLTFLYRTSDKIEARMDKAEAEKDNDKFDRLSRKDDVLVGQISIMYDVLSVLGYCVKYDDERNVAIVLERN